jgi:lipopolysaccharide heptosyltransferase I
LDFFEAVIKGTVNKGIERILVIRLSAIGDIVRTLPAVHALRDGFPKAHISWVVEEKGRDILLDQPEVDEIILFHRKRWGKGLRNPLTFLRTIREVYWCCKELRSKHYDICLDFHGLLKSGLISYLSGARERVGFARGFCKDCNYLFNNRRVRLRSRRLSRFERNLALIRSLGLEGGREEVEFYVSKEDIDYVDEFFQSQGLEMSGPLVAIHPATSPNTPYKRWPPSRYSKLADRLVEELRASVLFTWGPGERSVVDEVRARMRRDSMVAPETHSLKQLGEIFRRCSLYIGGDTGPMHIASLVKTPVVGIFGPTDPVVNAPHGGTPYIMVRKDIPCSPCRDYQCEHVECMNAVTTQDVFDAARSLLCRAGSSRD